ncbi:MAG: YwqI/YxiC family protein [Bacteroides sp.]|nr:YwqI/YxiC family protein [Bacteroides sp.]MCM1549741.1 YwqI/YxiC family protein [Clostridium sp.]
MGTFSFYIHDYQTKLNILSTDIEAIDAASLQVSIEPNESDTVQAYYDMYGQISMIIKNYKWALQHMVKDMKKVGETIIETEQDISELFWTGGE